MNRGSPLAALARGLHEAFGGERLEQDKPLGPLTTFKVGGPADLYLEPRTSGEILTALRLAHAMAVPVTLLGGGSNHQRTRPMADQSRARRARGVGRHPRNRRRRDIRQRALVRPPVV
jgi:hypothetical protein